MRSLLVPPDDISAKTLSRRGMGTRAQATPALCRRVHRDSCARRLCRSLHAWKAALMRYERSSGCDRLRAVRMPLLDRRYVEESVGKETNA